MKLRVLHYDTLSSTNDCAADFAAKGAEEGLVVFADYQTKGRGRQGRKWKSPRGKDLLFSLVLRPNLKNHQAALVTYETAKVIRDFLVHEFDLPAKIKRPNDVLVNGRKICGILVEASSFPKRLNYLVIGIGLNVNSRSSDLLKSATSLCELLKKKLNRKELLLKLVKQLGSCFHKGTGS